jgi:FkbM family methyltransferase
LRAIFDSLPNSTPLYRFCRRYVNRYDSLNNGDMRSNGELRWLREVLPMCSTVFDVGANVGDWTAYALGINPHLKIHCFEPSAVTYQLLEARGIPGKVFLNNRGLGAVSGELILHVSEEGGGSNSVYKRTALNVVSTQTEWIQVDTLDAYCERHGTRQIDLLKLDVEGHELAVLKGAMSMLDAGRIQRIQFEYGGTFIDARVLLKDMFDLLVPYGYQIYKIYPNTLRRLECYDPRLENFQYQNLVAFKESRVVP